MCRGDDIIGIFEAMTGRKEDPEVGKRNRVGASLQLIIQVPGFWYVCTTNATLVYE
jgi:hypothetical protein